MNLSATIVTTDDLKNCDNVTELHCHPDVFGEFVIDTESSDLNLRTQPNTNSPVICTMPKGHTFFSYGLTDSSLQWLLGECNLPDGKIVAGFCNVKYLIRKVEK